MVCNFLSRDSKNTGIDVNIPSTSLVLSAILSFVTSCHWFYRKIYKTNKTIPHSLLLVRSSHFEGSSTQNILFRIETTRRCQPNAGVKLDCPPPSPHPSTSKTVLDSAFHTVDSGFQVLDPGQWNLYSRLDAKRYRHPNSWSCIPDVKPQFPTAQAKLSRIPLHGASQWA